MAQGRSTKVISIIKRITAATSTHFFKSVSGVPEFVFLGRGSGLRN